MLLLLAAAALAQNGPPPVVLGGDDRPPAPPPPASLAHETDGWGLGVVLGLPTGLTGAWRPNGRLWYDAALAWSFERGTLAAHADAVYTLAELRTDEIPDFRFPVWIGVGPRIRLGDTPETPGDQAFTLGLRVPVGFALAHDGVPIEVFLELAPGLALYPGTYGTFDAGIGARYYFGKNARSPVSSAGTAASSGPAAP